MKAKLFSIFLTFILFSTLYLPPGFAQDSTKWGLPGGAETRLGKGVINAIAYSPDGSRLAVGASTGIWLYDAATGEERSLLGGHTGVVTSIAYSRDGKMLASVHNAYGNVEHRKHYVALWDTATSTLIKTLSYKRRGYTVPINSVAFSPDGTRVAVGDNQGGLLWNVGTGTLIGTLAGKRVESVTFSPDGRTIAGGHNLVHDSAPLTLWDGSTGAFKEALHPTERLIMDVAYSPDGTILACATTDGRVILWDVAASLPIDTFVVFEGNTPNVVAYSPDGKMIAVGAARKVSIWDAATGKRRHFLSGHIASIRSIAYSPDSKTVASGGDDGTVRFWNASTGAVRHTITGHTNEVNAVAYSPDGNTLAIGGRYSVNTVSLWDVATSTLRNSLEIDTTDFGWSNVDSLAYSPDGSIIAGGNYQETYLWDAATHKIRHRLEWSYRSLGITYSPDGSAIAGGISSGTAALSPDGTKLVTPGGGLSGDTMASLWDVATGAIIKSFTLSSNTSRDALLVWDVSTRRIIDKLTRASEDPYVHGLAYSPDGNTIAAASGASVYLWDAGTTRLRYRLTEDTHDGHDYDVRSVAFSPDSTTLASGGGFYDRTVLLWDVKTGTLKNILKGHSGAIVSLAFSPDGTTLASGSHDGTVLLWHHIHSEAMPPVFTEGTSATRTIAENTAAGVNISTPVAATDADDDTLTYTLSGADAAAFSMDPTTGQLRTHAALDYETKSTYTVAITVSDRTFTNTITVTINVTDINEVQTDTHIHIDAVNGSNAPTGRGSVASPYKSITYALLISEKNNLPDPWHVHIHPGIYNADPAKPAAEREIFPLILRRQMTFEGTTTAQECIIDAQHLERTQTEILQGVDTEAVIIRNLTIQNMDRTDGAGGIVLWDSAGTLETPSRIEGCIVHNNGMDGVRTNIPLILMGNTFSNSKRHGVWTNKSISASHNTFSSNGGGRGREGALYIDGDSTGDLSENTFQNNRDSGLGVKGTLEGDLTYNTFIGNASVHYNRGGGGFYISGAFTGNISHNIFTENVVEDEGGGFYISGAFTGNISHNIFTKNAAEDSGGGFYISAAFTTGNISHNTFTENRSIEQNGGGFHIEGIVGGAFTSNISHNKFTKNSARYHGGGFLLNAPFIGNISHNIFDSNSVDSRAGGGFSLLRSAENTVEVFNNIFFNNTARDPGNSVSIRQPTYFMNNLFMISDELSEGISGAHTVWVNSPECKFHNNIFSGMQTAIYTGGVFDLPITHNLFHNIGLDIVSQAGSGVGNDVDFWELLATSASDNIAGDPRLVDPVTTRNFQLQATSPAINAGTNAFAPMDDFDGVSRPVGVTVDIGPYEYGGTPVITIRPPTDDDRPPTETPSDEQVMQDDEESTTTDDKPPTETQRLREDVNADGVVSIQDLVLVAASLGQTGENAADVNGDGKIDITDLVLVAGALGTAVETPETTNNAPGFTEGDSTTRTVAENVAAGVNIGTPIVATDADDDTLTYSLDGADADAFSIDITTGQLKTRGTLDYETKATYTVTITVSDGSLTDTTSVTINITDIDETSVAPQGLIVSLSPSPVQSPAVGEHLTLSLNIASGKNVAAYQVTVQFDATALRYVSSADAGYLPGAFAGPAKVTENTVTLAATSLSGESDGDGTLATITFEVVAAKASTVGLTTVILTDSASNQLQVTSTDGIVTGPAAVDLVSGRTPQVRDAIVAAAGVGSAAEVTAAHLAAIEQLDLNNKGITALKAGDFDGLTALTGLNLGGNDFNTLLLQDIFDTLTSLIVLILPNNDSTTQLIRNFGGQVFTLPEGLIPNELQGTMFLFKVPSTPTVAGAVGDVNLDGTVNIQDLILVMRSFGKTGEDIADTNDDGVVDIVDLVNVIGSFGQLSNAAPSLSSKVLTRLTPAEIEELLTQIRKLDLTNPMVQQWITTLEHLLAALIPKETALLANYPNPFNPETWIPYQLAKPADVTLRIYAVDGTLVRTLSLGHKGVGVYQSRSRAAYWDGKNALGEPVASGVYFYTLTAGDFTATRKMLIRK